MIRTIATTLASALAGAALIACADEDVSKAEELADRACACESAACLEDEGLEDAYEDLLRDVAESSLSEDEDGAALAEAATRFGECVQELAAAELEDADTP